MPATKVTPQTVGAELLDELRQVVARHDGAENLDEAKALADDVSRVLRRARGRLSRAAKVAEDAKPAPAPAQSSEPARPEPVKPESVEPTRPPTSTTAPAERTGTAAEVPPVPASPAKRPGAARFVHRARRRARMVIAAFAAILALAFSLVRCDPEDTPDEPTVVAYVAAVHVERPHALASEPTGYRPATSGTAP